MKKNDVSAVLEACFEQLDRWEEEPEIFDPWQRNMDA